MWTCESTMSMAMAPFESPGTLQYDDAGVAAHADGAA
jgi:hypothetical protein